MTWPKRFLGIITWGRGMIINIRAYFSQYLLSRHLSWAAHMSAISSARHRENAQIFPIQTSNAHISASRWARDSSKKHPVDFSKLHNARPARLRNCKCHTVANAALRRSYPARAFPREICEIRTVRNPRCSTGHKWTLEKTCFQGNRRPKSHLLYTLRHRLLDSRESSFLLKK